MRIEGDVVDVQRGVSWAELETFLATKGDARCPRIHYLDGVLETVTPSRGHERQAAWIGALVTTWALVRNVDVSAYRSWLLKDQARRAGAEPDECFIVGDDSAAPLERPHFVIEVQWSRRGIDKLEVYKRLGVPEVWFWERDRIVVYVQRRGRWIPSPTSLALPELDIDQLASFLDRPTTTAAMRDYRQALGA